MIKKLTRDRMKKQKALYSELKIKFAKNDRDHKKPKNLTQFYFQLPEKFDFTYAFLNQTCNATSLMSDELLRYVEEFIKD
jgi:hypothetical protein